MSIQVIRREALKSYPVLDAQALTLYQLTKLSGGNVVPMAAASDALLGLSGIRKAASDGQVSAPIITPEDGNRFLIDLDAATTVAVGDLLAWATAITVTKSATNPIFRCTKAGTSVAQVECEFLAGSVGAADGIAALVDNSGGAAADGIIGAVAASAAATAGGATPTAAQVDTGIATAVATIVTGTNAAVKELATKINALLAALQTQ